jgi:hypothetical protein
MNVYTIHAIQEFRVSYQVEAESAEVAWAALTGTASTDRKWLSPECLDQIPGPITSTREEATIEEKIVPKTYRVEIRFDVTGADEAEIRRKADTVVGIVAGLEEARNGVQTEDAEVTAIFDEDWEEI